MTLNPKLVQGAKGNVANAVDLMFLIMVVTIFYLAIVLPFLLPGVEVNPWDIAKSLIVSMLIPLVIGMLIKLHSPDVADHWAPVMQKISSLSILILLVDGAAALLVATQNFSGTDTLPFVLVGVVVMLLVVLPAARVLGRRNETAAAPVT